MRMPRLLGWWIGLDITANRIILCANRFGLESREYISFAPLQWRTLDDYEYWLLDCARRLTTEAKAHSDIDLV